MMKALLFMVVGAIVGTVASNPLASMDQAMELATFTHELYLNATCRKFHSLYIIGHVWMAANNYHFLVIMCTQHLLQHLVIRAGEAAAPT